MIYAFIGMSLVFVAIGFIVTDKNAKYILSGYNTMNEEDRKKVDIKAYIPYFRNFHIFLGISFLVLGIGLTYFFSENAGGIFLAVYPIIAYIYFIITSSKYSKGLSNKWDKIGLIILAGALLLIVVELRSDFKENKITFDSESISFEGSYGEILNKSNVKTIELVSQLPEITIRTNGFALGTIKKGFFKTKNGEIVKLILNSENTPVLLLTKTNGNKIYYSAKGKTNKLIMDEMKKKFPSILFK